MPIYNWERDKSEIAERLRSESTLKLCVKTVDEPILVQGWIEHHARIVGTHNLIIADNGSTNQNTLDVYEKYSDSATIFQFFGPHNQIHWHSNFSDFFYVIKASCKYFSFIDVDERLIWISPTSWRADASIVDLLDDQDGESIIPTTWLINTLNSFTKFNMLDSEGTTKFSNNLRWGKPILPVKLVGIQPGIHNVQFKGYPFSKRLGTQICMLHLTQFPKQRVLVSKKKLLSNRFIVGGLTDEEIMNLELENPIAMRFIVEMRKMHKLSEGDTSEVELPGKNFLELDSMGGICYSDVEIRLNLSRFLDDGPALIEQLLEKNAI